MPYAVTERFEKLLAEYTGARYVCAVNSCTAAIQIAAEWCKPWLRLHPTVSIPKRTYVSVPNALKRAGYSVRFRDEDWQDNPYPMYRIGPTKVYDAARYLRAGMYQPDTFMCISFSTTKVLGCEQGGAILHDDPAAVKWFQRMRFDGRSPGVDPREDVFEMAGLHCIMLPSTAAILTLKLHHLPKRPDPLPHVDYPDLSKYADVWK